MVARVCNTTGPMPVERGQKEYSDVDKHNQRESTPASGLQRNLSEHEEEERIAMLLRGEEPLDQSGKVRRSS